MPRALVALGANLGDRAGTLGRAVDLLRANAQVSDCVHSRWHETPPIGGAPGQGPFLNGAVRLDTTLTPKALQALLHQTEATLGRERTERWAARALDLDLLLYEDLQLNTPTLTVPHPRMAFRRFVLEPAAEVAPDMIHPAIGWSISKLLDHLRSALPYVALLGTPGSGKTALAESLARWFGGRFVSDPSGNFAQPSPPNPPSHALWRQIQFLDARSRVLDRRNWLDPAVLAVSDFYFDQALSYAEIELDAREFVAFRDAWQIAHQQVVLPKLLVVLDEPAVNSPSAEQDRLRAALVRLAARTRLGPVLYVGGVDHQAQFDEISAAMQAMQPAD